MEWEGKGCRVGCHLIIHCSYLLGRRSANFSNDRCEGMIHPKANERGDGEDFETCITYLCTALCADRDCFREETKKSRVFGMDGFLAQLPDSKFACIFRVAVRVFSVSSSTLPFDSTNSTKDMPKTAYQLRHVHQGHPGQHSVRPLNSTSASNSQC